MGTEGIGGESWGVRQVGPEQGLPGLAAEEWSWTFICETGKVLGRLEEPCPGEGWWVLESPGKGLRRHGLRAQQRDLGWKCLWGWSCAGLCRWLSCQGLGHKGEVSELGDGEQLLEGAGFPREGGGWGPWGRAGLLREPVHWALGH